MVLSMNMKISKSRKYLDQKRTVWLKPKNIDSGRTKKEKPTGSLKFILLDRPWTGLVLDSWTADGQVWTRTNWEHFKNCHILGL